MAFEFPFRSKKPVAETAFTPVQLLRAYRQHFGHDAPAGTPLFQLIEQLIAALGADAATALCRTQSKDQATEG